MTGATEQHVGRRFRLGWRSVTIATTAAVMGALALFALRSPAPETARYVVGDSEASQVASIDDPLRAELARCRTLSATNDDRRCQAVWEVSRRRFMGESRSVALPPAPAPDPARLPIPTAAER